MMRNLTLALVLVACGPKTPPTPAASEAAATATAPAAPVAAAAPEPEPEPEIAAPPASNASFTAKLTFADGRVKQGKVVRVERGDDWYAESGWVDSASKLMVTLEGNGTQKDVKWDDIGTIDIKYGDRSSLDCSYDSAFNPWMYMCALRTTSTAKTDDGGSWSIASRHKWRFSFSDGTSEEFYILKLPERAQDTKEVDINDTVTENYELYGRLQTDAMANAKKSLTRIEITD